MKLVLNNTYKKLICFCAGVLMPVMLFSQLDSLYKVGNNWIFFEEVLNMDVDDIIDACGEEKGIKLIQYAITESHNLFRTALYEKTKQNSLGYANSIYKENMGLTHNIYFLMNIINEIDKIQSISYEEDNYRQPDIIKTHSKLMKAAQGHALDMFNRHYFSHYSPEGYGPPKRAKDAGYFAYCSENIAWNYYSVGYVMEGWIRSTGHYNNLTNPYNNEIGVGFKSRYYVVNFN